MRRLQGGSIRRPASDICPNDLMVLNKELMKAYNRDPSMCWECYNCVKICPTQAVEVRGYADFVPLGASVTAMRSSEDILDHPVPRQGHQAQGASSSPSAAAWRKARPSPSDTTPPATTTSRAPR